MEVQRRLLARWGCSGRLQQLALVQGLVRRGFAFRGKQHRTTMAGVVQAVKESATAAKSVPAEGLPSTLTGQVMSAASNFVRVELDELPAVSTPQQKAADRQHPSASTSGQQPAGLPTSLLLCNMRALLKKMNVSVLVGDRVRVGSIDWIHSRGTVEEVFPRSSVLSDPSVANVDHALLVFALARPPFEEIQVSRFLVSMEASGLSFTIVLNKADLVPESEAQQRLDQLKSWGYNAQLLSCEAGLGVADLYAVMEGKTSVVAGPSGAGKSSLINMLRLGRHRPDTTPSAEPEPGSATPAAAAAAAGMMEAQELVHDLWPHAAAAQEQQPWGSEAGMGSGNSTGTGYAEPGGGGFFDGVSDYDDNPDQGLSPLWAHPAASDGAGSGISIAGGSGSSTGQDGHWLELQPWKAAAVESGQHQVAGTSSSRGACVGGQPTTLDSSPAASRTSSASSVPEDEFLRVGEVSRYGRGKHTTTTVTLIHLAPQAAQLASSSSSTAGGGGGAHMLRAGADGSSGAAGQSVATGSDLEAAGEGHSTEGRARWGRVADTPGFSQPSLEMVASNELGSLFPEFEAASIAAGSCRFADCLHVAEPGCAVVGEAVQGKLPRYEHYLKFLGEIQEREARDVRLMQAAKRQREGAVRVKSAAGGKQRLEARLDTKSHRRQSRQKLRSGPSGLLPDADGL